VILLQILSVSTGTAYIEGLNLVSSGPTVVGTIVVVLPITRRFGRSYGMVSGRSESSGEPTASGPSRRSRMSVSSSRIVGPHRAISRAQRVLSAV